MKLLEVSDLYFGYDRQPILKGVNLTVCQGEIVGLTGPNGSGKTTLLKLCLGLLDHYSGQIKLMGKDIKEYQDDVQISYVPQKMNLLNSGFPASVEEVVATGLFNKNTVFKAKIVDKEEKVNEALAEVGLLNYSKVPFNRLSGGQLQRVFIARAIIGRPRLLILDEPSVGVDEKALEKITTLLDNLRKERDLAILIVTHQIAPFAPYFNQLLSMDNGEIRAKPVA